MRWSHEDLASVHYASCIDNKRRRASRVHQLEAVSQGPASTVPPPWYDGKEMWTEDSETHIGCHNVTSLEAGDGRDFVVTARDMTANEKRTFRGSLANS